MEDSRGRIAQTEKSNLAELFSTESGIVEVGFTKVARGVFLIFWRKDGYL
jgi:hypothetical protein